MARPPRIEGANLWYHVYNRGNEKRVVFFDDDDRTCFLDLLFESAGLFSVDVHSFALMPNHFHLMIATREANLCQFMQQFQNRLVKIFNARHDRVGHMFQDRYKAVVVDSEEYGSKLSRYIHLNIARSGATKTAGIRERIATLRTYPWSSYQTYVGQGHMPWPVATSAILDRFGDEVAEQQRCYARYVTHGLLSDDNVFENVAAGCILGCEAFVQSVAKMTGLSKFHDASARAKVNWLRSVPLETIVDTVTAVCGVAGEDILHQRHSPTEAMARQLLFWAAAEFSACRMALSEIGKRLGGVTSSALSHAHSAIEKKRTADTEIAKRLAAVSEELQRRGYVPPQDSWTAMCERLATYKREYGHARVPRNWAKDIELGAWVHRQRLVFHHKARNARPLDAEQIARLDQLGFCWTIIGDTQ